MVVTENQLLYTHSLAAAGNHIKAANFLLQASGLDVRVETQKDAEQTLAALYYGLLNQRKYNEAATLAWGTAVFNTRPRAVQKIWNLLNDPKEPKILILGSGSAGKTFTTAGWAVQWWSHDPDFTTGKIISTTKGHATSGIVAKCINLHKKSAFPLPGIPVAGGIEIIGDKSASISAIALPEGDTGEGRLTGFHPIPRPTPHPIFGSHGRVFAVVDEADVVPEGLWKGLDNMLVSIDDAGSVKVVCLTNPRNKSNPFAYRAEPPGGWSELTEDMETWISKEGWRVLRLDAKVSENVMQKKVVFPGFLTYEAYVDLERRGKSDPSYRTYARSLYPESFVEFSVMGESAFDDSRGRYTFMGKTTPVASFDPAFAEGGNDAILTAGTHGTAIAFTGEDGKTIEFPAKNVIQVEQQIEIPKGATQIMGRHIIKLLKGLGVSPEWFIMDKSGNGRGLFDYLRWQYGSIYGIEWGGAATEFKILEEDTEIAEERYKGIKTEMYFAAGAWTEHGFVKFLPSMVTFDRLKEDLTLVNWHYRGILQELETKGDFKAKNKRSPDNGDSFVMLPHLVRMQSLERASYLPKKPDANKNNLMRDDKVSPADDKIEWVKTI